RVELHNTNRALTLLAADAGWPDGTPRQPGAMKATAAADLLGIDAYEGWYHEWLAENGDRRPDLVLPLANDFSVRHAIGQRGESILVHATTSPNWTAELHRHVAGRDNHWTLLLELGPRRTLRGSRHHCKEACIQVLDASIRKQLTAGTRWAEISGVADHRRRAPWPDGTAGQPSSTSRPSGSPGNV
ncbi:MAG TPA: hypothetical protein VNO17_12140, partial [Actinomycetota bacterium]|nr:hypothetical protein [Actinomycetota bacterium]